MVDHFEICMAMIQVVSQVYMVISIPLAEMEPIVPHCFFNLKPEMPILKMWTVVLFPIRNIF